MLPKEKIFYDTLFILFAGFSTTYHNLSSTLYYLHKYPQKLNILKESLCKSNISNINVHDEESLKDLYENCNYLNYVVKEGLRIDPPVFASIFYQPKQNIEIWGLEIDKNTILAVNWALPHYNTKEWHNPTEFIPERFDPESDFFFKPNSDKKEVRSQNSYIPFSLGLSSWMGQSFAKLELRVVLSRIISNLTFSINSDQLNNDFCKFNEFSQMELFGSITSKSPSLV